MIRFNYNAAFITFCTVAGGFAFSLAMQPIYSPPDELNQDERLKIALDILMYSVAIALIIGIVRPEVERNEQPEEIDDDMIFDVDVNDFEDIPFLTLNNEYEERLIAAGYDLVTLNIPEEFRDPITSAIMLKPVILLSNDPIHHHTVDYTSYEYLIDQRNSVCPFSNNKIIDYLPDEHLKMLIEAWVICAELNKKDLSTPKFEKKMHNKLLKLDYYNTLFNRRNIFKEDESLENIKDQATLAL